MGDWVGGVIRPPAVGPGATLCATGAGSRRVLQGCVPCGGGPPLRRQRTTTRTSSASSASTEHCSGSRTSLHRTELQPRDDRRLDRAPLADRRATRPDHRTGRCSRSDPGQSGCRGARMVAGADRRSVRPSVGDRPPARAVAADQVKGTPTRINRGADTDGGANPRLSGRARRGCLLERSVRLRRAHTDR